MAGIWAVASDGSAPPRRLTGECQGACNFGEISPNGQYITYWDAGSIWVAAGTRGIRRLAPRQSGRRDTSTRAIS